MINNENVQDDFLELLPHHLDKAQEKALKIDENAVIAAGAGSGKTQVLATRFAWLIMTGQARVDEILTLTFTNKAASEMYQRIYQTLNNFATHEKCKELTEDNRKLAKEALDSFANAHIQTLDSYCGGIVRQCANRYGIKPDFTTGSADSSQNIKNMAFKFVIENKDNIGIQTFAKPGQLQNFAENTFASTIEEYTSLATEENYFVKKLDLQLEEIAEAWNYYALGYVADSKFTFNSEQESLKASLSNLRDTLMASNKKDDPKKQRYVKIIEELLNKGSNLFNLKKITKQDIIENTKNLKESFSKIDDLFDYISYASTVSDKIRDVNSKVTTLKKTKLFIDSISAYIKQYDAIYNLNKLFDIFLEKVNSSKRTSGNLSFNDITSLALKILLENEDIRNQEKTSFKKIMIDEFQDNNGKNRDLLYILALKPGEFENNGNCKIIITRENPLVKQIIIRDENGNKIEDKRSPNKLFFVGDEKQSIYKFRGAEVSVFNELTKNNENKLIHMTYNYRSDPELIQSFNTIFKGGNKIFPVPEERQDYEAYYDKDALYNNPNDKESQLPVLTKDNVPVHMILLEKDKFKAEKKENNYIPEKDQLAYFMAKKIFELCKENKNWKSVAILDRTRTDRKIITKYLNMFNIPYEVDQFNNIFEDGIINDFYNFFRICVYPSDINSYAVYLTSPLCGVGVSTAEIILSHLTDYATKNEISFSPFPEDEQIEINIKNDISEYDYEKYNKGKLYLKNIRSIVLQQQITTTISDLWHKKGYKYESLLTPKTKLCAEHFDMLFELGRQADSQGKSVSWFVDQLELLKKTYTSDSADIDAKGVTYPIEREEAVQIMTIHKSKGLQFDHVFVYGCIAPHPRSENADIFFDEEMGITIKAESGAKNYFFVKGLALAKAKELAEFRRLIYVAITRAIHDVYIMGSCNPAKDSTALLHLLEDATNKYYKNPSKNHLFNEEAGFDYNSIEPVTYNKISSLSEKNSMDEIRSNILKKAEDKYKSAEIISYECHPIERKTPSSLETTDFSYREKADNDSGEKYEIDSDVLTSASFSAADFGTLVHAYLEAQANSIPPENFEPVTSMFKNLTDSKIKETKLQCISMCKNFKKSKLGQQLDKAKDNNDFFRAEWGFRMMTDNTIFTGSIDLIYSNGDGTYTIVDYKSDVNVNPEIYVGQQHCYRTAASRLLKVEEDKISLYLYFLKHDRIEQLN